MVVEPVSVVVPLELAEVAVVEPVIDPESAAETVSDVEMVRVELAQEDDLDVNEPTNPSPTTIDEDMPRLFIPDGLPIEDTSLPPEIRRFAPWTWSSTQIAGVGLTVGAILSALSWLLWSAAQ